MHGHCVNQPQDTKVLINFFYNKHLYDLLVLFMQIRRETLRDPVCTTLLSFWLCGKRTFSLGVLDGHTRRTTLESDDRFFFLPHRFFMLKAVARSCEEHIFCFTHAPMDLLAKGMTLITNTSKFCRTLSECHISCCCRCVFKTAKNLQSE